MNRTICEDVNGKKFKNHKWQEFGCDCPECPIGRHPQCIRCYELKY
jgi:hypothetical protein